MFMNRALYLPSAFSVMLFAVSTNAWSTPPSHWGYGECGPDGEELFEEETFGGNGRTCLTCHSRETGTVSPEDAAERWLDDPSDPLFLFDGSDDGLGNGVDRMLSEATVLVEIDLPPNVRLADSPARSITVRRGIPSTLNTPALDPVLMWDGREPDLETQAENAIFNHAQATESPTQDELEAIAEFQQENSFFSSSTLRRYADGGPAPTLPAGRTASEIRGRTFFVDSAPGPTGKAGACATCHSGPMLNQTNQFLPLPIPAGTRFQTALVSEVNTPGNPVYNFIFTNPDGTETAFSSPDPGRSLATGSAALFDNKNAFKIPTLWGVRNTAPYFHDNSAATLEEMAAHYTVFFLVTTDLDGPGPLGPNIVLTPQDEADIVAYLRLLR
jgi:cytochrome c peroxidase